MDSPDVKQRVIKADKYVDASGNITVEQQKRLFNEVVDTYATQMRMCKGKERKEAADAMAELLGKKSKINPQQVLHGHFEIPPAYLKRVFVEGLGKVTEMAISGVVEEENE